MDEEVIRLKRRKEEEEEEGPGGGFSLFNNQRLPGFIWERGETSVDQILFQFLSTGPNAADSQSRARRLDTAGLSACRRADGFIHPHPEP